MANINIVVDSPISDGSKLKFRTPCDSTVIEGLEVKYPAKNGVGTLIKKFVFKDAHGTELSGVGNLFVSGVMIEVLLDVTHGVAYIKNADTNSYVEGFKTELQRLEESQKQFLAVAGNAVARCENIANSADGFENAMANATERAESVKGVYVGSGDMPEGYNVQIDDSGAALEADTKLSLTSENPVQNKAVTAKLVMLDSQVSNLADRDYIVEQGISDFWTYRKWASGIAECWGSEEITFKPSDQWGSLYVDREGGSSARVITVSFPTDLFTQLLSHSINICNTGFLLLAAGLECDEKSFGYSPMSVLSLDNEIQTGAHYMAVGRWEGVMSNGSFENP